MSEPEQYTLTLSLAHIALLGTALGERPYHEVRDLISLIQKQIDRQQFEHQKLLDEVRKHKEGNADARAND